MVFAALVCRALVLVGLFMAPLPISHAAESGLISKPSNHSVQETVERFEHAIKAKGANGWMVFTEIDQIAKHDCILASNTSTLSIDEIGSATSRPHMVVGMHFFSPANVMRLVEIVRSDSTCRVERTEPRESLWQAQTPQMFRYRTLVDALSRAGGVTMTDDAGAIEALGLHPKLVLSDARNLKVTYPQDLALAELILKNL